MFLAKAQSRSFFNLFFLRLSASAGILNRTKVNIHLFNLPGHHVGPLFRPNKAFCYQNVKAACGAKIH